MIHDNTFVDVVLFLAILLPSVILHEIAHGALAASFGDDTAKRAGRLTLNPVPHIDPVGSLLLPSMLALAGANVFGWAKPVPVNPGRFERPTQQMALVALIGPATNLGLAAIAGLTGPLVDLRTATELGGVALFSGAFEIGITTDALWGRMVFGFAVVNAALAVFNMLPIPPLDGSRLVPLVLSERGRVRFAQVSQYGFLILFVLLFVFDEALAFMGDVIGWVLRLVV
jgi:Zn-dependent protease